MSYVLEKLKRKRMKHVLLRKCRALEPVAYYATDHVLFHLPVPGFGMFWYHWQQRLTWWCKDCVILEEVFRELQFDQLIDADYFYEREWRNIPPDYDYRSHRVPFRCRVRHKAWVWPKENKYPE